jgi:hypothetical protein
VAHIAPRSVDLASDVRAMLARADGRTLACAMHRIPRAMEVRIEASSEVCGACGKTLRREAAVATSKGGLLCPLCFTKADILAAQRRAGFEGGAMALVGAIAAVLPFAAQAAALRSASAGAGGVDWGVLACGIVAALSGGVTIGAARARASGGWLFVGVLGAALGAYHLARGAGLVG